jgi:type VI secretion system protein ImpF
MFGTLARERAMANSSKDSERKDRLSPPLMFVFRMTDRKTARGAAARETLSNAPGGNAGPITKPQRVAILDRQLRDEVEQDIDALVSHVSFDSSIDLDAFPWARASILNFGFPDLARRTVAELETADLDGEIERILKIYEPRLAPGSLQVERDHNVETPEIQIRYLIRGDLSCEPLDVPVEFIADVDVSSGILRIRGQ